MLDIHRLRILVELERHGTLAAVAKALSFSPSAVSQQLSKLESEAGVTLIEPAGRRVRLTRQAQILAAHAEQILQQMELAESEMRASTAEATGTLRIAAFQTAVLSLLMDALRLVRERHPQLRIELTEDEPEITLPALAAREYDLVVAEEYPGAPAPRPEEFDQDELFREPIWIAAPTSLASHERADTVDLMRSRPWVLEPPGTASRNWVLQLCRGLGFEPDCRFTSTDLVAHRALVEAGHAIAALPSLALTGPGGPLSPRCALMPPPQTDAVRRVFLATRTSASGDPAIVALRDAIRETSRARGMIRDHSPVL